MEEITKHIGHYSVNVKTAETFFGSFSLVME